MKQGHNPTWSRTNQTTLYTIFSEAAAVQQVSRAFIAKLLQVFGMTTERRRFEVLTQRNPCTIDCALRASVVW